VGVRFLVGIGQSAYEYDFGFSAADFDFQIFNQTWVGAPCWSFSIIIVMCEDIMKVLAHEFVA